jgi:hypothetical protein
MGEVGDSSTALRIEQWLTTIFRFISISTFVLYEQLFR